MNPNLSTDLRGAALALLCLVSACQPGVTENDAPPISLHREVSPPLPVLEPGFQRYVLDARKGDTLKLETGTRIYVPGASLVDASGQVIQGEVTLHYREFHDVTDILLSGIPMRYDSAGENYTLKSAGMVEIRALRGDSPVFVAAGKEITVALASYREGEYNLYALDETTGNWQYRLSASPQPNPELELLKKEVDANMLAPIPPRQPDPAAATYSFDVDYKDFPNLATFENVRWQFAGKEDAGSLDPAENPWILNEIWESSQIQFHNQNKERCLLLLSNSRKNVRMVVRPVFVGDDYLKARKIFEQARSEYEAQKVRAQEAAARLAREAALLRKFPVRSFGIYNWDVILKKGELRSLASHFQIKGEMEDGVFLIPERVYLLMPMENTVVAFEQSKWQQFQFFPHTKNLLLAVLPGEDVALVDSKTFAQYVTDSSLHCTFSLMPSDSSVKSPGALRDLLKKM